MNEDQRRDLTTCRMSIRTESAYEPDRSVEAVLATGAILPMWDSERQQVIDVALRFDGLKLPTQVVLLETHKRGNLDAILGSVRGLRVVDGQELRGWLFFVEGDERAEWAWQKVRQGHLTDVSVGYRVLRFVDIRPRETELVRGVSYTAGKRVLHVVTDWRLYEVSLVPIGADVDAKVQGS